jgi:hypothetical protein
MKVVLPSLYMKENDGAIMEQITMELWERPTSHSFLLPLTVFLDAAFKARTNIL